MSYTWFKLHHELPDDIKVRRFTPQEKWAWVVLLCLASKGSIRGVVEAEDEDIAEYCDFNTTQDWLYYRDKLIVKGMLEINADGQLHLLHWEDRQYEKPSDKPEATKERKRKQRGNQKDSTKEASRDVTPMSRDVTPMSRDVTPVSRDVTRRLDKTRLDKTKQDKNRKENISCSSGFEDFWSEWPKKVGRGQAEKTYKAKINEGHSHDLIMQRMMYDKKQTWGDREKKYIPYPQTWLNAQDWLSTDWIEGSNADVYGQISKELTRLNKPGLLPEDWQSKTGVLSVSELNKSQAQEYLSVLRQLEDVA